MVHDYFCYVLQIPGEQVLRQLAYKNHCVKLEQTANYMSYENIFRKLGFIYCPAMGIVLILTSHLSQLLYQQRVFPVKNADIKH